MRMKNPISDNVEIYVDQMRDYLTNRTSLSEYKQAFLLQRLRDITSESDEVDRQLSLISFSSDAQRQEKWHQLVDLCVRGYNDWNRLFDEIWFLVRDAEADPDVLQSLRRSDPEIHYFSDDEFRPRLQSIYDRAINTEAYLSAITDTSKLK